MSKDVTTRERNFLPGKEGDRGGGYGEGPRENNGMDSSWSQLVQKSQEIHQSKARFQISLLDPPESYLWTLINGPSYPRDNSTIL